MLTLSTDARNATLNSLTALFDAGGAGKLVIGTTAMAADLVEVTFGVDSFKDAVNGVALNNTIADATVILAGTAAAAVIKNNAGTSVITGLTVGVSASNINITNLVLAVGDKISIADDAFSITQPAS